MKTSVYIEDGIQQLNLQPENDFEQDVLKKMFSGNYSAEFKRGEFYLCNGGYEMYSPETTATMIVIKEIKTSSSSS
jgi:hypothetical protein